MNHNISIHAALQNFAAAVAEKMSQVTLGEAEELPPVPEDMHKSPRVRTGDLFDLNGGR